MPTKWLPTSLPLFDVRQFTLDCSEFANFRRLLQVCSYGDFLSVVVYFTSHKVVKTQLCDSFLSLSVCIHVCIHACVYVQMCGCTCMWQSEGH